MELGIEYPGQVKGIAEQLNEAKKRLGWSVGDLSRKVAPFGVVLDRTTLGKKLAGTCPLHTDHAELLANLLETTLVWVPQPPRLLVRKKPKKRVRKPIVRPSQRSRAA